MSTLYGSARNSFEEVCTIPVPERTPTYTPVPHGDFIHTVQAVAGDLLHDHTLADASYVLANEGSRMFGVLTWEETSNVIPSELPDHPVAQTNDTVRMSAAIRNSYDRSMAAGLGLGGSVMCCSNLMLSGSLATFKFKHTGDVLQRLRTSILDALYDARLQFANTQRDAQRMREITVDDRDVWQLLGLLFGEKTLTSTQFLQAHRNWTTPPQEAFAGRTAFSAYNACNDALKSAPPHRALQSHVQLHQTARTFFDL
tara:strand:- start:3491 stop:4258 length:768 start_codon:yes stop_codon:yes gene_type:complete